MKKYNFYHENIDNIKPIENVNIKNLYDMYDKLISIFSRDTCAPRLQQSWSLENKTLGHCSITSFLVQDIFGGDVYGIKLQDGSYHCYNVIDNEAFDLTSEQFNELLEYKRENLQSRIDHFSNKEKYDRYKLLKKRLYEIL